MPPSTLATMAMMMTDRAKERTNKCKRKSMIWYDYNPDIYLR
jgi:hypothetical protein